MKSKSRLIALVSFVAVAIIVAVVISFSGQSQIDESKLVDETLLLHADAIRLGNPDAKVILVEFFDPACGTCADFFPFVKKLMADNPDQIQLVMRYAPFHQGADFVVAVLEATRQQGKFWETLEMLYANQSVWTYQHAVVPDKVVQLLNATNLDMNRLEADFKNPAIATRIQKDMADAKLIPVTQTPEFFANGRPLEQFGYQQLQNLVEGELKRQYK